MSEFSAAVKSTVDASSRNGPVDSWVHHPASKGRHSETVIDITSPESLPRRRLAADEKHRIEFWNSGSTLVHFGSSANATTRPVPFPLLIKYPSIPVSSNSILHFSVAEKTFPSSLFNLQPSLLFPRAFLWRYRRQMNLHYPLSRL